MRLLKTVSLTAAALTVLALPAMADWRDHHRGHYSGGGTRWSIGLGFPLFGPAFYAPAPVYYAPAPYYYEPAPVVVPGRVAVGREVGGGDLAVDVQRALARKGYYRGTIDGALGPQSRAALREWQADCRLQVTGQIDAATLRSLALL